MKSRNAFALLKFSFLLAASATSYAQGGLTNGNFESGSPGQSPAGWFVPPLVTDAGYTVQNTTENPKEGKQCVVISAASLKGNGFGNMMQSVDATPYRGKRVRFRAAVRFEGGNGFGRTQLWFRVDRVGGAEGGFFNNMSDRPITSSSWAFYEITGDVANDAESINVGCMLVGVGKAYIDAASIQLSDTQDTPLEKPRALTPKGLENLVAFTKLYGYVRHFHPSDAVEKADWNAYAMAGIPAVEEASSPADLAARLQKFFAPLAPTVRVFPTGARPATPAVPVPVPAKSAAPLQIVSWMNNGFGGGNTPTNQNIYRSRRVFSPKPATIPAGSPDPGKTFVADLGGGVSCEVPLALYAENNSALPRTAEPEVPKGVRSTPTGNDRTTRLADVVIAWNVFEHFYPYFDEVKVDWTPVLSQSLTSAATDKSERDFLDTLRKLVAAAKDGHGYVSHMSDSDYAQPPILADWVEGKFVVTVVGPGVSRVQPGDVVVAVDGKPTEEIWKTQEALISGATDQWRRHRSLSTMLAGPVGSSAEIQFKRGGDAPFTVSLTRAAGAPLKEKRPKAIEEIKIGYWYVDLDGGRANPDEFKKAVRDLSNAQGIVFDLRGYPNEVAMEALRRVSDKPITSALWNVPKVSKPDHQEMAFDQSRWPLAEPLVPHFRGKIAFITDGRAISYAESVMGIVENYKLGAIVGEPTAGTNGNVNPFNLPGGYTVIFTGMKVVKHDGTVHHGVGIQPTIPVHRTIAGVAAGKDELLEKALEYVRG